MPIRISHSGVNTYHECSEKYRLHYIEKYREIYLHSKFFFGSALDEGFSRILLEKKKALTAAEKVMMSKHENDVFLEKMEYTEHNKETIHIPSYLHARYTKGDYTFELLTEGDLDSIQEFSSGFDIVFNDLTEVNQFIEEIYLIFKNKNTPSDEETNVYNFIVHASLVRKGYLMLEAYRRDILPTIAEVFDLQKQVTASEGDDGFLGYIDVICSFNDAPTVKYVMDNKSSSKPYAADAADDADQLNIYGNLEGIDNVGYFVIIKQVYKKVPIIRTQIIKNRINDESVDRTFERIGEAYDGINSGIFVQNFANKCYSFGSPCPFYKKCHYDSEKGLVRVWKEKIEEKRSNENE